MPASSITPETATATMAFCELAGIAITAVDRDEVRAAVDWSPERCTIGGALHGGLLMSLADAAGAVAAFVNLPKGAVATTTISSATNFLRGVRHGRVEAISRPLHVGRTTIVVETELVDDEGRRVAKVTQTQAVLRPD